MAFKVDEKIVKNIKMITYTDGYNDAQCEFIEPLLTEIKAPAADETSYYCDIADISSFDTDKNIKIISFLVGLYGMIHVQLHFESPVNEYEALRAVDIFFSQLVSEKYFNFIKGDVIVQGYCDDVNYTEITRGEWFNMQHWFIRLETDPHGFCKLINRINE